MIPNPPGRALPLLAALACALAGATLPAHAQQTDPVSPQWAARWQADLDFAAQQLPELHANLYHTVSQERFAAALDSLHREVPTLAHHEIVVELARIVALVGDGHTRLTLPLDAAAGFFQGHSETPPPQVPGLVFRHYPIRLYRYADGLHVRRITTAHADLAGWRVVGIGNLEIAEAVRAVEPTVERDNRHQVDHLLPDRLVIPEVLHARGVVTDMKRARFVLEDDSGRRQELVLAPVAPGAAVEWTDAWPNTTPLFARHAERRYWLDTIPQERTLYFRYREVLNEEHGGPLAAVAAQLTASLDSGAADRLIIDLRGNPGGNNFLNGALLHGIIGNARLARPGALFAIIDRGTFSAAMMLAAELEKHTPVIFVGEPTGAKPVHYGDARKLQLPNSGLTVRVSTLYWQTTHPTDTRAAIEPHLPVAITAMDHRAGRDPVLDVISALDDGPVSPAGGWRGVWGVQHARYRLALQVERRDGRWTGVLEAPDLGLTGGVIETLSVDGELIRFTWQSPQGPFVFVGRAAGDYLVGTVNVAGWVLPFVLQREAS